MSRNLDRRVLRPGDGLVLGAENGVRDRFLVD